MASWPHSPDTDSVPFAPAPTGAHAWPLPGTPASFSTQSFGGARPWNCWKSDSCTRWHAGIDLRNAPKNAPIAAPEDAVVSNPNLGWAPGTRAMFLRTASGLFVVLGGFAPGSITVKKGDKVTAGQVLGKVSGDYKQLHLETYEDSPGRTQNSQWYANKKPPGGVLNPLKYVQALAGQQPVDVADVDDTSPAPPGEASPWPLILAAAAGLAVWVLGRR